MDNYRSDHCIACAEIERSSRKCKTQPEPALTGRKASEKSSGIWHE